MILAITTKTNLLILIMIITEINERIHIHTHHVNMSTHTTYIHNI